MNVFKSIEEIFDSFGPSEDMADFLSLNQNNRSRKHRLVICAETSY